MKDETETRPIPIDGALEHLREVADKAIPYGASLTYAASLHAAVEVLAEAISRAQDAEKARYPLHVVTADPSIEARADAACETYFQASLRDASDDPDEKAAWIAVVRAVDASRSTMTEEEALRWAKRAPPLGLDAHPKVLWIAAALVAANRGEIPPEVRP